MTAKFSKTTRQILGQVALGMVFIAGVSTFAFFGSLTKRTSSTPLMVSVGNDSAYDVSVDELSELFIMSNVAENYEFSAASAILSSYYSAKVQYTTNQYSLTSSKIEKPVITDVTGVSKGVITYIVEEGDTIERIIAKNRIPGLSVDQVRWSNGLKTASISSGNTLYLPAVAGIVYVTKSGDTPSSLASRYDSNASEICERNYLGRDCSLKEGLRIVLPGGSLPNTERPEYVAPVRRPASTLALRYSAGNPYVAGQCTWYAWQYRHKLGGSWDLPGNLGNARTWGTRASSAYTVNKTPAVNAVFVSTAGRYGHVGIVTKVNGDGTITITDMNGPCGKYCVDTRVISASEWHSWSFIHQRK